MRYPKIGALVIVEWEDASSYDLWADADDAVRKASHLSNVKTAGWFRGVDGNCLLVVCCASFENQKVVQTATIYRIPLGCIRRIVRLVLAK
jgi:hypothetical protein